MDKLKELLEKLSIELEGEPDSLNAEQVSDLRAQALAAGSKALESEDVDTAEAAAEAADALKTRKSELDKEAEQRQAKIVELKTRLTPDPEPKKAEPKKEEKPKAEETKPKADKLEKAPEPEKEPEPVKAEEPAKEEAPETEPVAEAPEPEQIAADAAVKMPKAPENRRPTSHPRIAVMTAAADTGGNLVGGQGISDLGVLADAIGDRGNALLSSPSVMGKFPIAHLNLDYSADRKATGDPSDNTEKINKIIASAQEQTREDLRVLVKASDDDILSGVVADGGLCAPVNVSYDIFGVGSDERPLRSGLTRFQANRGGIRFVSPPTLADITGDAVTVVTEAQDAAANTDKTCLSIDCGTEVEEKVSAIARCIEVGNFEYRTFREHVDRWWRLAGIAHAREAENTNWASMVAGSTAVTTGASHDLDVSRDFPAKLIRAAHQMRSRHRAPNQPLRVYVPDTVFPMMSIGRLRQLPGDNTYSVVEAQFRRELAAHNIAVASSPDLNQSFGAQEAGALLDWPAEIEVIMAFEGSWLHVDNGNLNFGLVRDSTLNASNNLQMMDETFETVAFFGVESLHITIPVCADGSSSGTVTPPSCEAS